MTLHDNPKVMLLMGSDSDWNVMSTAYDTLREFDIPFTVEVSSAHRTPDRTVDLVRNADKNGVQVFIVGAGAAAHLGGVVAAVSTRPVVSVPLSATPLSGLDALLATVQMPGGVPVGTMAIGKAGAKNAALYAVSILALQDAEVDKKLTEFRSKMELAVADKSQKLKDRLNAEV